jgi:hypothetical protein
VIARIPNAALSSGGNAETLHHHAWPAGYRRRKTVTVRNDAYSTLGGWLHLHLTDPALLADVAADGDLYVTDAAGNPVPFSVLARTAQKVELAAMVRPASATAYELYVYSGPNGTAPVLSSWRVTPTAPGAVIPLTFRLSDGSTTTQSIHPNVIPVPTGSWMKSDGTNSDVTHVMVNTPYPGLNADHENPSLLYSRNNGTSWAQWPGINNPIDTPDANCHLADPCLAIRADGSLLVMYRSRNTSTQELKIITKVITGTTLAACSASARSYPVFGMTFPHSPTIYKVSSSLWYCFGGIGTYDPQAPYSYYRWTSVDEGATWTDRVQVLQHEGSQTAVCQGWWHGGQVVKVGDWHYMAVSEYASSVTHQGVHGNFRLWRSRDLLAWEPSSSLLLTELPSWASTPLYTPCLYLDASGVARCFYSSYAPGSECYCSVVPVTLPDKEAEAGAEEIIGRGRDTQADDALTDLVAYDFAEGPGSGLTDLSDGTSDAVAMGSPLYTAGTGYRLLATNSEGLDTGVKLSGLTAFDIQIDFTTGAFTGAAREVILADSAAGGTGTRAFVVAYKSDGLLYVGLRGTGALTEDQTVGAVIAASTRYHLRVQYTAARGLQFFLDGARLALASGIASQGAIYDSTGTLTVGRYTFTSPGAYASNITVHRLIVKTGAAEEYLERAPTQRWSVGHAIRRGSAIVEVI